MDDARTASLARNRSLRPDRCAWDYRRIWAYLRRHDGLHPDHKRYP